jgi:GT2 family glycosyltransferase
MISRPEKIVILGFLSHFPVAGVAWQTLQYLEGFRRLGFDVYYVESHGCIPSKLMRTPEDDGVRLAADYISDMMERFGMRDRWAYHAPYPESRYFGLSQNQLKDLYRSAALMINLHGSHLPKEELCATNRLVYLGTDPVEVEVAVFNNDQETIDYLSPHCSFFTFGENMRNPDCLLPAPDRFQFHPTRQPVVLDYWGHDGAGPAERFTTVGNWRQSWRKVELNGEVYRWSKHLEFEKFIDLPRRVDQSFELALASYEEKDRLRLEGRGWKIQPAAEISQDLWAYRDYIVSSRGEFTVAKDQNVRLRTGWFSDRAATYLAAGRPVITQETGFSNIFPTGTGLFAFTTTDEIVAALDTINGDYQKAQRAAREIAHEYFDYAKVLSKMLEHLGLSTKPSRSTSARKSASIPRHLEIQPISRWPTRLPEATVRFAELLPPPTGPTAHSLGGVRASIILVTHNSLLYTKLCLTSLLENGWSEEDELIVFDNASEDGTVDYLEEFARTNDFVQLISSSVNVGFAAANNRAARNAKGRFLIFLNNDTLLPRGWQDRLINWLEREPKIGLIGPATNRACNEAQVETTYKTYAGFTAFAQQYTWQNFNKSSDIRMLALFCAAIRRDVFETVGPLDEQFEIGMFEDDDYAQRLHLAGYRTVCVDDVFIHHFGQASLGELCSKGDYDSVYEENRHRFESKWKTTWLPHDRRHSTKYLQLREQIRGTLAGQLPYGSTIAVVSKGDEQLIQFDRQQGWHFPQDDEGRYANVYPADSAEAIAHLEDIRGKGATHLLLPEPAYWWLEFYGDFKNHLSLNYDLVMEKRETCLVYDLRKSS